MRPPAKIINDAGRHRRLRELLRRLTDRTPLTIRDLERSTICDSAFLHWHWMRSQAQDTPHYDGTKEAKHRIIVCWLRHEASNYDDVLDQVYAMPLDTRAKYLAHRLVKTDVLTLIAKRYPEYRDACKLQIRETRSKTNHYRRAA